MDYQGKIAPVNLALYCSGRRVFYSIATGRTTEIAEVSRRQPLDVWKTGPEVLTNGKLRRENADAESGIDSRLH